MAWFNPKSWFGGNDNSAPGTSAQPAIIQQQGIPGPSRGLLAWLREKTGGYIGPQLSRGTVQEREITSEKVASGPRGIAFPWFLPYLDNYTRETTEMRVVYRYMIADPRVKAALYGKLFGVASLDLRILPANKKNSRDKAVAKHIEWMFTERLRDGVAGMVWSILSGALVDGYSICEKVWALEDKGRYAGKYSLSRLKPKDVDNDVVVKTDPYRNINSVFGIRYNAGEEFSPADFLIYRHMPQYDAPTGMSDLRAAYRSYWQLDTLEKLRAVHCEKAAIPMLKGSYANTAVKASLESALAKAKSQRWLSVPEAAKVELLELAGSAADVFDKAVQRLQHDIFLGIQYAFLQSLEGETTDGAGNSQVHASQSDKATWYLANTVQCLLNDREQGLIKDAVDLNYVVAEYPTAKLSSVDVNELAQEMQIDTGLKALGWKFSIDELSERYGRTLPESPEDELKPPEQGPGAPPPGGSGGALPFVDINGMTAPPKLLPAAEGQAARPFRGQRFSEAWRKYLAG